MTFSARTGPAPGCPVGCMPCGPQMVPIAPGPAAVQPVFGPDRIGQLGDVSDIGSTPPRQPRRRKAPTLWQSSWAAGSSLALGIFTLANFFSYSRNPWWLHLAVGLCFVLGGLANLQSALKLRRNRRPVIRSYVGSFQDQDEKRSLFVDLVTAPAEHGACQKPGQTSNGAGFPERGGKK
jgi:hypothetical protein